MSVKTVRETNNYSYDIDTLYGTGWFVRKRDDMVSLMDTGSVVSIRATAFPNLLSDDEFDKKAEEETYTCRWEEDS
jgi:hypothetical protein